MLDKNFRKALTDGSMVAYNINFIDSPAFDKSFLGVTEDGKAVYDFNMMQDEYQDDTGAATLDAFIFCSELAKRLPKERFDFIYINKHNILNPWQSDNKVIHPTLSQILRFITGKFCVRDIITGQVVECDMDEINRGETHIPDDWMERELYDIKGGDESSFLLEI